MRSVRLPLLALALLLSLSFQGGSVFALDTLVAVRPDRAFYRPGETVTLLVTAGSGARVTADVTYLADVIATIEAPLADGTATLTWTPPADVPRGYGLDLRLLDTDGTVLADASTAFDVLTHWTQAPRYGFLSEFSPGRDDIDATLEKIVAYHVNGLQFYDWQYRHEILLPPDTEYSDVLGRPLSMETVTALIDAAHARGVAAMPYTAIYGASVAFYRQHPDWALFRYPGQPYEFGDDFLVIMNPAPDSPWTAHLLGEFTRVLDETAFDGIHIDQYGAPMVGLDVDNQRVNLDEAFPAFINLTADIVQEKRGDEGATIFNAVRNWPVETVAPANQDVVYIEVWDPYREFLDLHRIIVNAQELGGNKPVILAAYIHPRDVHNVRLANAFIFGSGGYHLELGEPDVMLADPYFPRFGEMDAAMQAIIGRTYDFVVRYENVLALNTVDATGSRASALTVDGLATGGRSAYDRLAVVVRQGSGFETFNLINLVGIAHGNWNESLPGGPTPQTDLAVTIRVDAAVSRVWAASPDGDDAGARSLDFTTGSDADGDTVTFTLPRLDYWQMIVLDYAP